MAAAASVVRAREQIICAWTEHVNARRIARKKNVAVTDVEATAASASSKTSVWTESAYANPIAPEKSADRMGAEVVVANAVALKAIASREPANVSPSA